MGGGKGEGPALTEGNKEVNVDVLDYTRAAFLSSPNLSLVIQSALTIAILKFGVPHWIFQPFS